MKIYALTSGEYSDYQVEQITTNKEIAEAYAKIHNCEIEEYDELTDISLIETSKEYNFYIHVSIDKTGAVYEDELKSLLESVPRHGIYLKCNDNYIKDVCSFYGPRFGGNHNFHIYCKADLPNEQIIKVAKDVRSKLLSEKFGL